MFVLFTLVCCSGCVSSTAVVVYVCILAASLMKFKFCVTSVLSCVNLHYDKLISWQHVTNVRFGSILLA